MIRQLIERILNNPQERNQVTIQALAADRSIEILSVWDTATA